MKWDLTDRGREPIEIHVRLSPDDEVLALRAKVAALEAEVEKERQRANTAEFRHRCESIINQELTDLCRKHGIRYRPALDNRPW